MRAWVDESALQSRVDVPMYLLGASLTSTEHEISISSDLRCRVPRGKKLHWRELGDRGKTEARSLLSTLPIEHVIVIAGPLRDGVKQERARGQCIERLLWELSERMVDTVTFESRSPAQDRADRRRVDGLRGRQYISTSMHVQWTPGATEPLLWLPDLIVGAVGDARAHNRRLAAELNPTITEISIEL